MDTGAADNTADVEVTRILFIEARRPGMTHVLPIGIARKGVSGWHFLPFVPSRRNSRKAHATWEICLPRWTGGLDKTESIAMLPGEDISDACKRFPAVPEFEVSA